MTTKEIAERRNNNPCINCGCDIPAEHWRFVKAGVLVARCPVQSCRRRQLAWLFDEGAPMFNDDEPRFNDDEPVLDREIEAALSEPMTAAEADARLVDGLEPGPPPANSPEDIGGPDAGWRSPEKQQLADEKAERARANLRLLEGTEPPMPARKPDPPPPDPVEVARAQRAAATTRSEREAAERKLRKEDNAKKQQGFAGLWGKDRDR